MPAISVDKTPVSPTNGKSEGTEIGLGLGPSVQVGLGETKSADRKTSSGSAGGKLGLGAGGYVAETVTYSSGYMLGLPSRLFGSD